MTVTEHIRDAEDFRVTIAWNGAEDKPFPRALLVASSQARLVEERAFWMHAVIDGDEYVRMLDALDDAGREIEPGAYTGDERGYYVEVEAGESVAHTPIGFSQATVRILERMNAALDDEHRAPIQKILDRLSTALPD